MYAKPCQTVYRIIVQAVDKWKNARIQLPNDSVEGIAEIVIPDAAGAMLLTTSTIQK